MINKLVSETFKARQRVYSLSPATPLQQLDLQSNFRCFIKREDLSPIHAYKWRGAHNLMSQISDCDRKRGVITASAGNHAQGVALSANKIGMQATVYMPISTPQMKRESVKRLGGKNVNVVLFGNNYDEALKESIRVSKKEKLFYIHAFDDLQVIAGQGTIADEMILSGKGPFDIVFLQIGGGGLAAGVGSVLKHLNPDTYIVGVEGKGQDSMACAIQAGNPLELKYVDVFCDGTAVKKVGNLTYKICNEVVNEFMTVSNEEVSAAIELLWKTSRIIPEPSGAMGVAAILKRKSELAGKNVAAILCGANIDFHQLGNISRVSGIGSATKRYFRFSIKESFGELLRLIEDGLRGLNIVDLQYGKIDQKEALPIIGIEGTVKEIQDLPKKLKICSISFSEVTSSPEVAFRVIPLRSRFISHAIFIELEFPERPGSLSDFLNSVQGTTNICYFNYHYTGEQVGRALIGFEFESKVNQRAFVNKMDKGHWKNRDFRVLSDDARKRIIGG